MISCMSNNEPLDVEIEEINAVFNPRAIHAGQGMYIQGPITER